MKNLVRILALGILFSTALFLISCGDDDGGSPAPDAPELDFNPNGFDLPRSSTQEVTISVLAPGGLASLTADGDEINFTEGSDNIYTATLSVSAELAEPLGEASITVIATDDSDQSSSANLNYTVIGQLIEYTNTVITTDETWFSGNVYRLSDDLDIDGSTLTIEEGVIVQLEVKEDDAGGFTDLVRITTVDEDDSGNPGTLVVNGTAENPVVFTPNSDDPEPGMWQGIRINGGSGHVLNYVRIEYAGSIEENDAGGLDTDDFPLRMDDVTGADIDYLQIHSPVGGAMRISGGSFDMSHIVINNTNPGDYGDGHAIYARQSDNGGYVGNIQFLILNNPQGFHGEREILADGGSEAVPPVSITFSNVTGLGPGRDFEDPEEPGELASLDFARLRRGGVFRIYNSIIAEYPDDGIRRGNTPDSGEDDCRNNYIFNIGGFDDAGSLTDFPNPDDPTKFSTALRENFTQFAAEEFNNEIDPFNTLIAGIGVGDYTPDEIQASDFDPSTIGAFFEAANYVGAIGSTDWTLGWTLNTDGSLRE